MHLVTFDVSSMFRAEYVQEAYWTRFLSIKQGRLAYCRHWRVRKSNCMTETRDVLIIPLYQIGRMEPEPFRKGDGPASYARAAHKRMLRLNRICYTMMTVAGGMSTLWKTGSAVVWWRCRIIRAKISSLLFFLPYASHYIEMVTVHTSTAVNCTKNWNSHEA